MSDFDLEDLVNVEQTFYDEGYKDGFTHGRIHGLIEGRALGREKGFEMWEEVGFYEGFALTWHAIYNQKQTGNDRVLHHAKYLLDLIAQFPRVNPSSAGPTAEVDIPKLFRQIRSRYKVLCTTLGIRPSLRASDGSASPTGPQEQDGMSDDTASAEPKKKVWNIKPSRAGAHAGDDLSF
ncbi:DUF1715-domain-containing protein [Panus rudis PR-1116 ss-1]|nr:DUF1715-domain-containing protein [Panus rudis PR-1116 ss-1]